MYNRKKFYVQFLNKFGLGIFRCLIFFFGKSSHVFSMVFHHFFLQYQYETIKKNI